MARKKAPVTIESCLKDNEKLLQTKAENIIKAKELGISQSSIDKMIFEFALSKQRYDKLKRRLTDGK